MIRRTILTVMAVALAAFTAQAQDAKVEISGTAGWTFSDGISGNANDSSVVRVDPKDAFSWGLRVGFMVSPNVEVGALFGSQATTLETLNYDIADLTIYNYHGYFAYNFGEADAKVRPYVLGGLGATQYGTLKTQIGDISGETRFSSTWAAGLKLYPSKSVGIRLEGRWTPTYIKSDPTGYWCDPYWGCYVTGDAQYANQFELSGGITLRF